MRSLGSLPKPVLFLEVAGIIFLLLAYLSLHGYVALPGPFASATASIVMVFSGIALMLPAAVMMVWAMAQNISPLLTKGPQPKAEPTDDKAEEKRDNAGR